MKQFFHLNTDKNNAIFLLTDINSGVHLGGDRTAITSNSIMEGQLGKFGIIFDEDVIHEVLNGRHNFKSVSNFLWSFK